jgi:hypothetical protein
LLAILAATNVLYHFPPLFTMLSLMSTRPELADAPLDRSLYVELFTDTETLARVAHHWLSSITTAGVALMLLATRRSRTQTETPTESIDWPAIFAARIALCATVLQLPTGLWLLLASPAKAQSQLLGGEISTTLLFATAILTMVVLLQNLAAAALGDSSRSTAVKTALLLLTVLLLMAYVLHRTRSGARRARMFGAKHSAASECSRNLRLSEESRYNMKEVTETSEKPRRSLGKVWQNPAESVLLARPTSI